MASSQNRLSLSTLFPIGAPERAYIYTRPHSRIDIPAWGPARSEDYSCKAEAVLKPFSKKMSGPFETRLYIDGKYVNPVRGQTFENVNPATGEKINDVSAATAEDVDLAVAAAKRCLNSDGWGYKSTGAQRAVILRRLGAIFTERKDEIARLDVLDHGKPKREAHADLNDAISACAHFAMLAEKQDRDQDEVIDNGTNGDFTTKIRLEPIGVVAAITPWNYPFLMAIWKVIPAIAAGCTIVLKPSELAPLSCILLAQLCADAGLPAGALNVLPGLGPDCGSPLVAHPGVDKVSFTGSCPTAQRIMRSCADGPKNLSLELGGKSPLIAFEDCDIDTTVDWIIVGFCWVSGQNCSATTRVLIQSSIRDRVLARLTERLSKISIGNSLAEPNWSSEGPVMGPVINKTQYDKIWAYIEGAKAEGIKVAYGGDRAMVNRPDLGAGFFIPPTVFVDVPRSARVWNEEIFGPVLCLNSFETEAEAVEVANDSDLGLAGAVFSADADRCTRVQNALRCGVVWKNSSQPTFIQAPWGGVKKSGFGRELGRWGLEEFTSVKQVTSSAHTFKWGLW
jgi:betaine-aldehyde dehydrogenase